MPTRAAEEAKLMTSGTVQCPAERTVLVTGGAGFIGSHMVHALLNDGHTVRVLDNFTTGKRERVHRSAELIEADIRVPDSIEPAFRSIDCVFHMAALPRVPLSIEKPLDTHMVNVVGTINVLLAAKRAGVRRVIFSGSSSVYGNQVSLPLVETMTPDPQSPYALQKLTGEYYVRLFAKLYDMQTLTLRYFNVFGRDMATEGAYLTVISAFLQARQAGLPLPIDGNGEQTRDFTHVHDVVNANLLAMTSTIADGRPINIGQGNAVSVNWIADRIGGPRVFRPSRRGDIRHTLADNRAAREFLRWAPRISTSQGLQELLEMQTPQHEVSKISKEIHL